MVVVHYRAACLCLCLCLCYCSWLLVDGSALNSPRRGAAQAALFTISGQSQDWETESWRENGKTLKLWKEMDWETESCCWKWKRNYKTLNCHWTTSPCKSSTEDFPLKSTPRFSKLQLSPKCTLVCDPIWCMICVLGAADKYGWHSIKIGLSRRWNIGRGLWLNSPNQCTRSFKQSFLI